MESPAPQIRAPLSPEAPKESTVSRLLITPITFLSFLLSLALVDSHNYHLRTKSLSKSPSRSQPTTLLGRVRRLLHGLVFREVDAGPYAYVRSPNLEVKAGEKRDRSASGHSSPSPSPGRRSGEVDEPWHWHTKQKKMMRAEFEDALKLRKWVVLFLGLVVFSGLGMVLVIGSWMVGAWRVNGHGPHVRTDL
ncbi:uncharacterized protein RAG0_11039 [Rhynchosporium agropyri]|uniref:Uncharacterized protein n=1 Tax=Rhynchosporium agropyri TaxID=914238 RepID=A0A1E1L2A5_9HELO|nr:uncharacterized protein RAG0_11039 [Rhynchosporium agropyri]